jgi:hypothetical protein
VGGEYGAEAEEGGVEILKDGGEGGYVVVRYFG